MHLKSVEFVFLEYDILLVRVHPVSETQKSYSLKEVLTTEPTQLKKHL